MNTKMIGLTLLISLSPAVLAENLPSDNHHEVTAGGIGLVVGSLAAGPLGAIIGGSLGVMTGHNQTQTETIHHQQQHIADLERELSQTLADLSLTETAMKTLENQQHHQYQQYLSERTHYADSYQLDIYFLTNSSALHPQAQQGLDKLVHLLKNTPNLRADLAAYSDWRGTDDANCLLANQRLTKVANYLRNNGALPEQLLATNYGEHNVYSQNSRGEQLFYDRRVTISLSYFSDQTVMK